SGQWVWCFRRTYCGRFSGGLDCFVVQNVGDCPTINKYPVYQYATPIPGGGPHGPFVGGSPSCPNLTKAMALANAAINNGRKCQGWFDARGRGVCGPWQVNVRTYRLPCLIFPSYTAPGTKTIAICSWACSKGVAELASLLIHEMAHYFCPPWDP